MRATSPSCLPYWGFETERPKAPDATVRAAPRGINHNLGAPDPTGHLLAAAAIGFFPSEQAHLTVTQKRSLPESFTKADYRIRQCCQADIDVLQALEKACWPTKIKANQAILETRLNQFPQGQFILEYPHEQGFRVAGVIYTQRIQSLDQLQGITAHEVSKLHCEDGPIFQLLAVNVFPALQSRGYGQHLLSFALRYGTLLPGIETIAAVTLCKAYHRQSQHALAHYIHGRNEQGHLIDPTLRFHERHGAQVVDLVPGYRPHDRNNEGYGVIVRYDLAGHPPQDVAQKPTSIRTETHITAKQLEQAIADILGEQPAGGLQMTSTFMELGLDSADLHVLGERLSALVNSPLGPTFFFQHTTPNQVLAFLRARDDQTRRQPQDPPRPIRPIHHTPIQPDDAKRSRQEDVAIISAACRLPGDIHDPADLWHILRSGSSPVGRLPEHRWQWPAHIDPDGAQKGIDQGGFLRHIDRFDASFFHISPAEARVMDPRQRFLLELAWETLERAGIDPHQMAGSHTGVFIGASDADYCRAMDRADVAIEGHHGTGASLAVLANRISYFFDLQGPSLVTDTACSSSLVAVHQAVQALGQGSCSRALVGGAHLLCHPGNSIAYHRAGMLASDGQCKTFDARADGYVRGEGAVLFLLEPLQVAQATGAPILGVIKGSAMNHGGRATGLTAPNAERQAQLLRAAWRAADVPASSLSYIETHGTGTPLGDPIEVEGLCLALAQGERAPNRSMPLGLGSIKTNLGHLEAAAGVAGLLKVVLALKHRALPANRGFRELNPAIRLKKPLYVVDRYQDWATEADRPRRAGVSSFGSGGANAHVVVEEYRSPPINKQPAKGPYLFVLSARNEQQLRASVTQFHTWLAQQPNDSQFLHALTQLLRRGRTVLEERLAVVADDYSALMDKLANYPQDQTGIWRGNCQTVPQGWLDLIDEDIGDQIVDQAIRNRQLERLAMLWTGGAKIDWEKLDGPWQPGQMYVDIASLPTYPFARTPYWFTEPSQPSPAERAQPQAAQDRAVPRLLSAVWQRDATTNMNHEIEGCTLIIGGNDQSHSLLQKLYPTTIIHTALDLASLEPLSAKLAEANPPAQVIYLCDALPTDQHASHPNDICQRIQHFHILAREMAQHCDTTNLRMPWTVITLGGSTVFDSDEPNPTAAAIQGLVGSANKEYACFPMRILDVDRLPQTVDAWAQLLQRPYPSDGRPRSYREGHWYRPVLMEVDRGHLGDSAYRQSGVYVVLGGAGGLGIAWSRYMIRQYGAQIIWLGRRPLDATIRAKQNQLATLGPVPDYMVADAADERALAHARTKILQRYHRLDGVIHATLGHFDQGLAQTGAAELRDLLRTKVDTSLNMARVFAQDDLDFLLFFSSVEAFLHSGGHGGYAAGCSFVDAFAKQLANQRPCKVATMNWGHWDTGSGLRIPTAAQTRLAMRGMGFLETKDAMPALEFLAQHASLTQLVLTKSTTPAAIDGYCADDVVRCHLDPKTPLVAPQELKADLPFPPAWEQARIFHCEAMQPILLALLRAALTAPTSVDLAPQGYLAKWRDASQQLLAGELSPTSPSPRQLWDDWQALREAHYNHPGKQNAMDLVANCLRALPDILQGNIRGLDLLFPNGSLEQVRSIYRQNPEADFFNQAMVETLRTALETMQANQPGFRPRILEIGAGTGATTESLLAGLGPLVEHIDIYDATDISLAFLTNLADMSHQYPCIRTQHFDVETAPAAQGLDPGSYDFVIATNVLHATQDLRRAVRHAKSCLRPQGILLLNELCAPTLFGHLTFGLLPGWWRYTDPELRLSGTPLVDSARWQTLLKQEGFQEVVALVTGSPGQAVFAAISNGVTRLPRKTITAITPQAAANPRKASPRQGEDLRVDVHPWVCKLVARILRVKPDQIDTTAPLEQYGFDSILVRQLTGALQEKVPSMPPTLLFEVHTVDELVDRLLTSYGDQLATVCQSADPHETPSTSQTAPKSQTMTTASQRSHKPVVADAVAIIGLNGRYPGADNLATLWDHLRAGHHVVDEIPADRWDWREHFEADIDKAIRQGKSYSKWGAFLDRAKSFDAHFFGITPREAVLMDPQERIFLEVVWAALEDAGHTRDMLANRYGHRVGVFAGVTRAGFERHEADLHAQGGVGFPRTSFSSLANRVSYFLDLQGPSMPIDTMCSSSLTAVHVACEQLQMGACDLAIAGGVNLYLHPSAYASLCAMKMLSPDGRCKSFGKDSNGFVPGEGAGVVILKPLSHAIADGDHIHGIIRGSHVNHGGKTNGYTVPSPKAQAALIRQALDRAGVNARNISYVEAHGTGTALGDPIEITGLSRAFRQDTAERNYCALGSIKTNLGHLEAAAGIAGLTKVLLQFKHRQLVPSLHATEYNPDIDFAATPFRLQRALAPWPEPSRQNETAGSSPPRIAAVSSFGAGGVNAHVVVEESSPQPSRQPSPRPVVVPVSARSTTALQTYARDLRDFLTREQVDPRDLAFTFQVGREAFKHRLGLIAQSNQDLIQALDGFLASNAAVAGWVADFGKKLDRPTPCNPSLHALADAWVKGDTVDWQSLYPANNTPRRIPAPTYPFEHRHYWLVLEKPAPSAERARPKPSTSARAARPIQRQLLDPAMQARRPFTRAVKSPVKLPALAKSPCPTSLGVVLAQKDGVLRLRITADSRDQGSDPDSLLGQMVANIRADHSIRVVRLDDETGNLFASPNTHFVSVLIRHLENIPVPILVAIAGTIQHWPLACVCDLPVFKRTALSTSTAIPQHHRDLVAARFGAAFSQRGEFSGMTVVDDDGTAQVQAWAKRLATMPRTALVALKEQFSRSVHAHLAGTVAKVPDTLPLATSDLLTFTATAGEADLSATLDAEFAEVVQVHDDGDGIAVITMADQQGKNTFTDALSHGLRQAFAHVTQSPNYKVVILTGYASYFACGGTRTGLLAIQKGIKRFTDNDIYALPLRCPLPVIAAMQGHALGGGWSLGLFCDLAIYSQESMYQAPYMQYGFTPGAGSTLIFPTRLGPSLSREILFTGWPHKGVDLAQRSCMVLPRTQVLPRAYQQARTLAGHSRARLMEEKRRISQPLLALLDPVQDQELAMHAKTFVGQDEVLQRIEQHFSDAPAETTSSADTAPQTQDQLQQSLRASLATELLLEPQQIDPQAALIDMGLDSIAAVTWIRNVNAEHHLELTTTDIYNHPTLARLVKHVTGQMQAVNVPTVDPVACPPTVTSTASEPTPSTAPPADPAVAQSRRDKTRQVLRESLAAELLLDPADLDETSRFVDLGLDSISAVTWTRNLNAALGCHIPATKVYDYATLADLAQWLAQAPITAEAEPTPVTKPSPTVSSPPSTAPATAAPKAPRETRLTESRQSQESDDRLATAAIAVIGMAGRFPDAPTVDDYWANLAAGRRAIREIPAARWSLADYFDSNPNTPGKTYNRWMGAVADIDRFDSLFFNISPSEAEMMSPQQRLFLEASWHCIEHAGYDPAALAGSACGVFVGCEEGDYRQRSTQHALNAHVMLGASAALLPARIAYFLDLQGPCLALDTACSSSLVAIANACDNLTMGRCNLALAGGAYLLCGPEMHIMLSHAGMLSRDGHCYAFDHRANGFVPGEGVGAVLLKRLDDAERDHDNILGVIRGWGVNQDGKTNGITAPSGRSQHRLQKEVYQRFKIDPNSIQMIEAHGTGTALGDPIEVDALCTTFANSPGCQDAIALGSVKSNIGHSATAAGVAGVIKILLSLRHQQIPPMVDFASLNPQIHLDQSPFYINTSLKDWRVPQGTIRRAAINAFGYSGTNAHLVIEEYVPPKPSTTPVPSTRNVYPVLLSAKNKDRLQAYAQRLLHHLETNPSALCLRDVAFTLTANRTPLPVRLAIQAVDIADLISKLRKVTERDTAKDAAGIWRGKAAPGEGSLAQLANEVDVSDLRKKWLATGQLGKVAKYWVQGVNLDWSAFFLTPHSEPPRRVCLPGYPFADHRYWIGTPFTADGPANVQPETSAAEVSKPPPARPQDQPHPPSLDWLPQQLGENIPWATRCKRNQDHSLWISSADPADQAQLARLLDQVGQSVGHPLQPLQRLDTQAIAKQLPATIFAFSSGDDLANWRTLQEALAHCRGDIRLYFLATSPQNLTSLYQAARGQKVVLKTRFLACHKAADALQRYQFVIREWLGDQPLSPMVSAIHHGDSQRRMLSPGLQRMRRVWLEKPKDHTKDQLAGQTILILAHETNQQLARQLFRDHQTTIMTAEQVSEAALPPSLSCCIDIQDLREDTCPNATDLAQRLAAYQHIIGNHPNLRMLYLTLGLHGFQNDAINLVGAQFAGFIPALAAEDKALQACHLDIDAATLADNDRFQQVLATEASPPHTDAIVCLRNGKRFVPEYPLQAAQATAATPTIRPDAVYVISGGTGGIGRQLADELVRRGATQLVLMGRHPIEANDPRHAEIQALRDKVKRLELFAGELEKQPLASFFTHIRATMGPIAGVIHAAGQAPDLSRPSFLAKRPCEMVQIMAPKTTGLAALANTFATDDLDFFVAFSSLTSLYPEFAKGACDYAAANAYVDWYMAHQHRRKGAGWKSITWVDWHETGMVQQVPSKILANMQRNLGADGFRTHANQEGRQLFFKALCENDPWVFFCRADGNRQPLKTAIQDPQASVTCPPVVSAPPPHFLSQLRAWETQIKQVGWIDPAKILAVISLDEIKQLPSNLIARIYAVLYPDATSEMADSDDASAAHQALPALSTMIRDCVRHVLKLTALEDETPFQDYGLDSISAAQLAVRLEKRLARPIPPQLLIQCPTVDQLTRHLQNTPAPDRKCGGGGR